MKRKMLNKGDLGVDELDQDFIDEVCNMRMEIAYKRFFPKGVLLQQTATHFL